MTRRLLAPALRNRTPVLLLALLVALAATLSSAHVHVLEKAGSTAQLTQAHDCMLCHASHGFTFNSGYSQYPLIPARTPVESGQASNISLGYTYLPESRPPPTIS